MPLRHTCAHVAKPPHCDLNASALRLAALIAAQIERGEGLSSFLQSLRKSLESWGLWRPRQGEAPAHAGEAQSGGPFDDGAAPVTARLCTAAALQDRPDHHDPVARLRPCDLRHPDRAHPHRADPPRRGRHAAPQPRARACHGDDHRLAGDRTLACPPPPGRRRAAPCPHRQPVQRHRRGAGDPARDLRQRVARPRPRPLVLHPHQIHHSKLGGRGDRLCPGARPGDPRRHARHGQGHRRGGQPREVAAASLRQFPVGASLDQGAAHRLPDRR